MQWLRADLAIWGKILDREQGKASAVVQAQLSDWKADLDLGGVRDLNALKELPRDERNAWQKLWKDVDNLLASARGKK
jgi:hypothetical protein